MFLSFVDENESLTDRKLAGGIAFRTIRFRNYGPTSIAVRKIDTVDAPMINSNRMFPCNVCSVSVCDSGRRRGCRTFSQIYRHFASALYIYICIYTRARAYLQLSISIWQSCRSIGKYCRFIGHDAVIVKLQQMQKQLLSIYETRQTRTTMDVSL